MAKYILKRILYMALILLIVTTITFFLLHAIPGDPITAMVQDLPEETRQIYLRTYGFDRPVIEQYFLYIKQLFTGDLGQSLRYPGRKEPLVLLNKSSFLDTRLSVSVKLYAHYCKRKWKNCFLHGRTTIIYIISTGKQLVPIYNMKRFLFLKRSKS